jgi:hypothetical protein
MKKQPFPPKYYQTFGIAFLLLFAGVSCLPVFRTPASAPIIQTVVVTREVTQEVTRIVEVPVTVTPTATPVNTDTPAPTPTNTALPTSAFPPTVTVTPVPPAVTVLVHTLCLYGPDPVYLSKYELLADSHQWVIGRNQDSTWLYVQGPDHKNPCWVKAELVNVDSGNINDILVTEPVLSPYSTLYTPPQAVSANRVGNEVTIFWLPVPMTEADYHGYLIEAWVCQGGQLVFVPKSYSTSFDKNDAMLAVKITDEPGCLEPSSARIYTVENHGYSNWKTFPWPAPTATLTPAP